MAEIQENVGINKLLGLHFEDFVEMKEKDIYEKNPTGKQSFGPKIEQIQHRQLSYG